MSAFSAEALVVGIKEGAKLAFCFFLVARFFKGTGRPYLRTALLSGMGVVLLATLFFFTVPVTPEVREYITRSIGYVFGIFFIAALVFSSPHIRTGRLFHGEASRVGAVLSVTAVFLFTVLYFFPDMAGAALYVRDLFGMSGAATAVFAAGLAGFIAAVSVAAAVSRIIRIDLTAVFGLPQVILTLAMVKLFAGGVRGFAEFSLIGSVQRGLMKFVHDLFHHVLVTLMVPDHQILSVTTWNFIGLFFGETFGLWMALVFLTAPLIFTLSRHLFFPPVEREQYPAGAAGRKQRSALRRDRWLKALPLAVSVVLIAGTWFAERGETQSVQVNPPPVPVVAEAGKVTIPLSAAGGDLRDGLLHKFVVALNGESVRILVMQRSDGTLAVCLDACEICPPDGYALSRGHVVCIYCSTPIPVDTLGQPGGCNPIPLAALVTEDALQISLEDIAAGWKKVGSSRGKGEGGR